MIKIDQKLIVGVQEKASFSERKRCNYNFHAEVEDTLQRMLNVLNIGTYIRPHKHEDPDKREAFIILEGRVIVIEFDNTGNPIDSVILDPKNQIYGCEIAPRTWHSIICLENGSVLYELKDGPYNPLSDKNFATWAPAEGSEGTEEFNRKLIEGLKEL